MTALQTSSLREAAGEDGSPDQLSGRLLAKVEAFSRPAPRKAAGGLKEST